MIIGVETRSEVITEPQDNVMRFYEIDCCTGHSILPIGEKTLGIMYKE